MKRIASLTLSGVLASSAAFAGPSDNSLNLVWERSLPTLNAYFSSVTENYTLALNLCDTLAYRNVDTLEVEPLLATGWTWTSPTELDMDLREGVSFHDGQPFTADDVVATLNLVSNPDTGVNRQVMVDWIDHVEKLGDYRVRIHLKEADQSVFDKITGGLPIYPAAYLAEVGLDAFGAAPICTGPYKLVSFDPGSTVVLEKNADYFAGSPKGMPVIDRIEIRSVQDGNTRVAEFMTGRADWIHQLSADQADQLGPVPGKKIVENESNRIAYVMFNPVNPPAGSPILDPKVREAVGYAIDRESMVEHLVRGASKVLNTFCHPRMPGCLDNVFTIDYDPEKAKALLAEAGYPDGFDIDLFAFRDRYVSEALIGDLQAVGIRANLQYMQYGALDENWQAGRLPFAHQSWSGDGLFDAGSHLTSHFLASDTIAPVEEIQQAIRDGNTASTQEERDVFYAEALKALAEGVYWVPLYTTPEFYAVDEALDFKAAPDGLARFFSASWQ
ncbi:ABC transporter substrate-binding protein [Pseudogemmobacter sonorensis]|uniref:ABC transporter substrate-binding protein n=1 Tax=Pseudogemmobacter sonorensis TaxID=2989681 RepID=UPI0036A800C4